MGKISGYNKAKFVAAALFCVLLLASAAYAADSQGEFELFDRGYKDYLSYHPGEAAEEFRTFLKEFPRSSARDAVLFWLGKSLEQLKSFEEAKRIFADIKREYPDSPFVRYANKEIETLTAMSGFAGTVPNTVSETKTAGSVGLKTVKTDDQARTQKKEIQKAAEQKEESKSLPAQKEISKKAEIPAQLAAVTSGKAPPPVSASEPNKEALKKAETPLQPTATTTGSKTLPPAPQLKEEAGYSVQVGVFKIQRKAETLSDELKRDGYDVKVRGVTFQGQDIYKVLVGKFAGKNEADAVAGRLKSTYQLDALVTTSEAGEVRIAQIERSNEAGYGDRLKPLSGRGEKSGNMPVAESGKIKMEGEGSKPLPEKQGGEISKKNEPLAIRGGKAVETSQSPVVSKRGVIYSVQIGVFHQRKTIDKLKSEFEKEGYPVKIIRGSSKGKDVFKVLVGQFADKNEAKSIARVFEKQYGENTIVSMSESRDEIPAGPAGFTQVAEGGKKPGSVPEPAENKAMKIAATATHPAGEDLKPKDVQAKTQLQQASEETNKHAGAIKNEKETEARPVEKKKDDVPAVVAQAVNKEYQPKLSAAPKVPELAKSNDKAGKNSEGSKVENKVSVAPVQPVGTEKPKEVAAVAKPQSSSSPAGGKEMRTESVKKQDEKKEIKNDNKGSAPPPMDIKALNYETRDVQAYAAASRSLCDKLQIRNILWRTGNDNEDFLNEQVLYSEAKNLHITVDKNMLTEMIKNHKLDDKEADYLQRYLTVSSLIEKKIREMPEEKVVESIAVRYSESDRYMKTVLGSNLQTLARKGTPFEEIYRLYPDIVRFSITGFTELERQIKEKVQTLQDNEIVATWSEGGYMILKPVFKGPVFTPFGDISPGLRARIRTYVLTWTKGLREKYATGPAKETK